jgi:hypothetical protein
MLPLPSPVFVLQRIPHDGKGLKLSKFIIILEEPDGLQQ